MIKLILGMGIPGSGKTTFLKDFAERYKYEYVCADDMRTEFGVSHRDPRVASENPLTYWIWDQIRDRVRALLKEGKTVVLDATFVSADLRREFISLAKKSGAEKVQGVFLDTPSQVAWERSEKRERKISEEVFNDRVKKLKDYPPALDDGFNAIFTIQDYENILKGEIAGHEKKMEYRGSMNSLR